MPIRKKSPQLVTDLRPSSNRPSIFKRIRRFIKKNLKVILIAGLVLSIVALSYGYINTRNELKRLSNPQTVNKDAAEELVDKVGKLIQLPEGETPTTANVRDASELKNQEFFARAQDGDKVLIYSKSGRAVLYRPSINKVIEFSKVNLNNAK